MVVKNTSRALVKLICHVQDIICTQLRNGGAFGYEITQQTIVALVLWALPGAVRMRELDLGAKPLKCG